MIYRTMCAIRICDTQSEQTRNKNAAHTYFIYLYSGGKTSSTVFINDSNIFFRLIEVLTQKER